MSTRLRYPLPGRNFSKTDLPIVSIDREWFRLHDARFGPIFFNREPTQRFNAPARQFGTLYVGDSEACAFVETFAHDPATKIVSHAQLGARGLASATSRGPLRLVDLTGEGLRRIGGDGSIVSGLSYRSSQRWALAIYTHPSAPDGILYRARHDQALLAAAIFDRAATRIVASPLGTLADPMHATMLGNILDRYDFGLV